MFTLLMFIPPTAVLVSLRSRAPLIIVVLWLDCPAIVFLMVILKSPVIGFSVSGLRCANEMAVIAERPKTIVTNRSNLLFMIRLPFPVLETLWGTESKLSKSATLLKMVRREYWQCPPIPGQR